MKYEKIFIDIDYSSFVVHLAYGNFSAIEGEVYPIQKYYTDSNNKHIPSWGYIKSSDGSIHEELVPDDSCKKMFDFSFCWRGIWEGRIYFKDDEYWSEELKVMSELWDKLVPQLKEKIKMIPM
ncbi:MAG: hypothetical protein WC438_05765 [Candidatus Pacearchaeota archaeon]|jgi:hypothetical protein